MGDSEKVGWIVVEGGWMVSGRGMVTELAGLGEEIRRVRSIVEGSGGVRREVGMGVVMRR